ncbi:hypothetical protein BO78DRAFT_417752 [Aspergillus sclerotiicarbonarius CBS 121057]|uniref:Uncharacterized protein n=1 Tax=Aspergillus sclerotiicarbonarius (strain CBS 121057 / IBT 28362) TaxID=1448318 RepID=A0A319EYE8_ASPSB|nr:hypothetical protein BO78DRAFT_417752 [Aspergillus sclerotiicarbonarius CBS 121057]
MSTPGESPASSGAPSGTPEGSASSGAPAGTPEGSASSGAPAGTPEGSASSGAPAGTPEGPELSGAPAVTYEESAQSGAPASNPTPDQEGTRPDTQGGAATGDMTSPAPTASGAGQSGVNLRTTSGTRSSDPDRVIDARVNRARNNRDTGNTRTRPAGTRARNRGAAMLSTISGTRSSTATGRPLDRETAFRTTDIGFDTEAQFLRHNGQPDYLEDSGNESDEPMPDADPMRSDIANLDDGQAMRIVRALARCDNIEDIIYRLKSALPANVSISLKEASALCQEGMEDPQYWDAANDAYQMLEEAFQAGLDPDWYYQRGGPSTLHWKLHRFHMDAYSQATQHLKTIAKGTRQRRQAAMYFIFNLNATLEERNLNVGLHEDVGIIDLDSFFGIWETIGEAQNNNDWELGKRALRDFCKDRQYPTGWGDIYPPRQESRASQSQSTQSRRTRARTRSQTQMRDTRSPPPPRRIAQAIAITERTVTRYNQPGFTCSGEEILYVQELGKDRARFVTRGNGKVRLVACSAAGGKLALEGASNKPKVLKSEDEINNIRNRLRQGGQYGLSFVAISDWEPEREMLPLMVVGFYYQADRNAQKEECAISRSNLYKILSKQVGEKMITEAMDRPGMELRDALESCLGY